MTPLLLSLVLVQAVLLFRAAIHLSSVFLRSDKGHRALRCATALMVALVIAWYGSEIDPHRILCGIGDGLGLVLSVACVRFWAVTREDERRAKAREIEARRAAAAAVAAREIEDRERLLRAAAEFESRKIAEAIPAVTQPMAPRHLAPSLLRGGAGSSRVSIRPRK